MSLSYAEAVDGTHIFHHRLSNSYLYITGQDSFTVSSDLAPAFAGTVLRPISCLLGCIRLKLNTYVVIAESHTVTGRVLDNSIARITSHRILPVAHRQSTSSEESTYISLLNHHLNKASLFFSPDNAYDLTNSLQLHFSGATTPDPRFWWNQFLCEPLVALDNAHQFITPVIYGYFKSTVAQSAFGPGRSFLFALLTRRSVDRAGTRYFRRGIDETGNVANFNETEQIFQADNRRVYSLVQTRGSVPVYWLEINNLRYRPHLVISAKTLLDATKAHFDDQCRRYGNVVCVNLVNQTGYERPVKLAYENAIDNLDLTLRSRVKYIYFDFHHECSKMRWDRVKLLLGHLEDAGISNTNYFSYDLDSGKILTRQNAIVRSNCMDCLDRTNVVQSVVAQWVLLQQMHALEYRVPNGGDLATSCPDFNRHYMNMWADNADAVSCAYSGTGALKTDYTRTGTRTRYGAFADFVKSAARYYGNNMADGRRQDGFDLFLGRARPRQHFVENPFLDKRPAYVQLLPYTMGTAILIFAAILAYPRGRVLEAKNMVALVACLAYTARSAMYVYRNGYQFVAWPKLCPIDFMRQQELFDVDGKLVGTQYVEASEFVGLGKKTL